MRLAWRRCHSRVLRSAASNFVKRNDRAIALAAPSSRAMPARNSGSGHRSGPNSRDLTAPNNVAANSASGSRRRTRFVATLSATQATPNTAANTIPPRHQSQEHDEQGLAAALRAQVKNRSTDQQDGGIASDIAHRLRDCPPPIQVLCYRVHKQVTGDEDEAGANESEGEGVDIVAGPIFLRERDRQHGEENEVGQQHANLEQPVQPLVDKPAPVLDPPGVPKAVL